MSVTSPSPAQFKFKTDLLQSPAVMSDSSFHKLPSPRSKNKATCSATEQTTPPNSPLGLKSAYRSGRDAKLLREASSGELKDQFIKSVLNGAQPDIIDIKASEVEVGKTHIKQELGPEEIISSALAAQLLKRLAIGNHQRKKQSPPTSPKSAPPVEAIKFSQLA